MFKRQANKEEPGLVRIKRTLDNPVVKAEVYEFKELLKRLTGNTQTHPLDYYGHPLRQMPVSKMGKGEFADKFGGFVINDLLGGVHWSVVKYAEDSFLIRANKYSGEDSPNVWSIVKENVDKFCELMENIKLSRQLDARIAYAKKMSGESLDFGIKKDPPHISELGDEMSVLDS